MLSLGVLWGCSGWVQGCHGAAEGGEDVGVVVVASGGAGWRSEGLE